MTIERPESAEPTEKAGPFPSIQKDTPMIFEKNNALGGSFNPFE